MRAILIFIVEIGNEKFLLEKYEVVSWTSQKKKKKKLFHKIFIFVVMIEKVFVENRVIL